MGALSEGVPGRVVVLYDDACGFCRGWVERLQQAPHGDRVMAHGLGSAASDAWLDRVGVDAGRRDTVFVVWQDDALGGDAARGGLRVVARSDAVLLAARTAGLRRWWLTLAVRTPRWLRDAVYRFVARNRGWLPLR